MNTLVSSLMRNGEPGSSGREAGGISAAQRVYEELRGKIISLALPPDTVLSRNEIAREFGVSLTPVREALQQLEAEGLVHIFPQSRTQDSRLAIHEIQEAQLLRVAVETEVIRRLAVSCSQATLNRLRSVIAMQEAVANNPDEKASFQELDEIFHRTLMAGIGHENLHELLKSKSGHFARLRQLHLPDAGRIETILSDHRAILSALEKGDPQEAELAMREHLSQTIKRVEELRARHPQFFR